MVATNNASIKWISLPSHRQSAIPMLGFADAHWLAATWLEIVSLAPGGIYQHGMSGPQSLSGGRRLGDDDRAGQDGTPGEVDGERGEDSNHGQDAPRVG